MLDRIVYVVTNPVKANLCKRAKDWPGVMLFAGKQPREIRVTWVDRNKNRFARIRAASRGDAASSEDTFRVDGRLVLDSLLSSGALQSDAGAVDAAIEARERELADVRRRAGRKTLTRKQVLAQDWRSAPSQPSRSPRPLCHSADPSLRRKFREGFREFVGSFREGSERLRRGDANVSFPAWCYPPGLPQVRPMSGLAAGAG